MFKKYTTDQYSELKSTRNILVLVGNGFDISALSKFPNKKMPNRTTSYEDFYDYMMYYKHVDKDNKILNQMTDNKKNNLHNWADFEYSLQTMIEHNKSADNADNKDDISKKLIVDLDEIKKSFSYYLYDLITPDVINELNNESQTNRWASKSMRNFLHDLPYNCGLKFSLNVDNCDLVNYVFVNFNYTPLFDNYIYLDTKQFDPHCYSVSDRNFNIFCNRPTYFNNKEWQPSVYLMSDVVHPNGIQNIPRSLIFGASEEQIDKVNESKFLNKPFVGQYDNRYFDYFDSAELFIVYGMSLGITDHWWFDNIFKALANDKNKELIIYFYNADGNKDKQDVKDLFYQSCILHKNDFDNHELLNKIYGQIYIVLHEDNNTNFLGFKSKCK